MERKRDSFFLPNKKNKPDYNKKQEFKKQEKQKQFDERRNGLQKDDEKEDQKEKKPFDKKTYRLKKYSKKYKLEKWEEQRKKKLLHDYQKSIKNEAVPGIYKPKSFDEDVTDSNTEVGKFVRHPDLIEKEEKEKFRKINKDPYLKAKEQYNKVKQEKIEKQEAMKKAKEERDLKLQEYKKKKHERFKKLSKKTKKGQPVMTGRLELLLEKIQSSK